MSAVAVVRSTAVQIGSLRGLAVLDFRFLYFDFSDRGRGSQARCRGIWGVFLQTFLIKGKPRPLRAEHDFKIRCWGEGKPRAIMK